MWQKLQTASNQVRLTYEEYTRPLLAGTAGSLPPPPQENYKLVLHVTGIPLGELPSLVTLINDVMLLMEVAR